MHGIDPGVQTIILRSIDALAAVCDHAQSRDKAGFSKATAGPGHEIAALGTDRWTPEIWHYAGRLSAHHSRQLEAAKVIDERETGELRLFANSGVKAPPIKSDWTDVGTIDGQQMLIVSIKSNRNLVSILKRARDMAKDDAYQPAGNGRLWRISSRFAFVLKPFLGEFEIMSPEVEAFVDRSRENASTVDLRVAHEGPIIVLNEKKNGLRFVHRFSPELKELLHETKGGTWWKDSDWNNIQYTISLNEHGFRLFELLRQDHNAIADEDAAAAITAAQNVPAPKISDVISFEFAERDGRLTLKAAAYVPEWVAVFRTLPGRKYDNGQWTIPAVSTCLERLLEAARRQDGMEGIVRATEALLPVLVEREASDPEAARAKADIYPSLLISEHADGKQVSIVMSNYVEAWVSIIKGLPRADRSWSGQHWNVRNDAATFDYLVEGFSAISSKPEYAPFGAKSLEELSRHRATFDTALTAPHL
jgi:hypothetical protein